MTVYEKLAEIQHLKCELADDQIIFINEARPGSDSERFRASMMCDYIADAYALGLVMNNLPVEIAEREI